MQPRLVRRRKDEDLLGNLPILLRALETASPIAIISRNVFI
jgi:hypothetical protein